MGTGLGCSEPIRSIYIFSSMKLALVIAAFSLVLLAGHAQTDPLIQPNDRLAFCGDGMTAELGYTVYVEDYLMIEPPKLVQKECEVRG
jgi:hypothetical protein